MDPLTLTALTLLILAAALLYSSVGHGGASAYLALMALFGLAPGVMKPAALLLNIVATTIATTRYYRAGHFSWALFWPFACGSVPLAFIGGSFELPVPVYRQVVGTLLLLAAFWLLAPAKLKAESKTRRASVIAALAIGALIGLLSGLTGVGGGIFLSPLILLRSWAGPKETAAVSAGFILVNSIAGLLGHVGSVRLIPGSIYVWGVAAVIGSLIGSWLGSSRLSPHKVRRLLGVVLIIAGLKLMLSPN